MLNGCLGRVCVLIDDVLQPISWSVGLLTSCGPAVQEPEFSPGWREAPWLVMLGILGVGIPQSLVFVGNHQAGAANTPILVPTTPVYVALLSAAFRMEPFNRYRVRALPHC